MKTKYEVASEVYYNMNGKWELFGIPKHVKMFDNYYEAIKEYGKFYNKSPSNYELT